MSEQTVLFLHLPKTGGITLGCSLRWQYGFRHSHSTAWKKPSAPNPFGDLSRQERERLRLVKGHVVYGLHQFFDAPCTYITLVRHPVRRILSLFYFLRRNWPGSEMGNMTLSEFLDRSPDAYTPNDQVCRIAGHDPNRHGPATEDTLEQAKQNIDEHFTVCGLTERFDESLLFMKRRLNWSRPPFYVRSNTNSQRPRAPEVNDALINRIRADHSLDLRLHAHVTDQLETAIDDELERDLQQFRRKNGVVQSLLSEPLRLFRAGRRTLFAR